MDNFSFSLEPIFLDKAIYDTVESMKALAQKETKEFVIKDSLPHALVSANSERLIQVIENLLSNALKFSPKNSKIFISSEIKGKTVVTSITDQGKGIPKEFQPKMFEKFARAESGYARKTPGTGLGLYLCKNIIEKCGGKIGFHTEENVGTTLFFELPLIEEEKPDESKKDPAENLNH